jgi:hypothetical protein
MIQIMNLATGFLVSIESRDLGGSLRKDRESNCQTIGAGTDELGGIAEFERRRGTSRDEGWLVETGLEQTSKCYYSDDSLCDSETCFGHYAKTVAPRWCCSEL